MPDKTRPANAPIPPSFGVPAERTLPPWAPWAIAAVGIAVITAIFLLVTKEPPAASGEITKAFAVQQTSVERVLAGVEIHLKNETEDELLTRDVVVRLKTSDQEFTDTPASSGDLQRYIDAYPEFKQSDVAPLKFETRIPPKGEVRGLLVLSFPITKERFDSRQDLDVRVSLYGRKPITLKQSK